MKPSLFIVFAFGFIIANVIAEEVEEVQVDEDAESRSGVTQDKVSARVHPHLMHHHHLDHHAHLHHGHLHHAHLHHGHHAHLHHAHHMHAFAHHHPILTKKLLLLKFKKLGALAHHHHHGHHHHLHHLLHHGHHHHLHAMLHHHHPHHHHLFRASPGVGGDSILELIPISDPAGTLSEANAEVPQSDYQYIDDNQEVQAYAVPADYLQGQLQEEPELDNYEEVSLDEVPESAPINKHLVNPEEGYDESPVYLYAVPQQVELGRSVNRVNKNRRKFKN